jgi:hypothetical protein
MESSALGQNAAIKSAAMAQKTRCLSIISTALGCHESTRVGQNGNIYNVIQSSDKQIVIRKEVFVDIVNCLPQNKQLKESLWKAFTKMDPKSIQTIENMEKSRL